jgi:flagellar hook assembly protein FlgD
VTVCVLNGRATVLRTLTRPRQRAGRVTVPYYGHSDAGGFLRAGKYKVLVVASNRRGSATAESTLTIKR